MTELNKLMDYKKPIYAAIETCGGSRWITPSKQRHPYPYEIRCEVWMAIIHGAKGIVYFTHSWVEPSEIGNLNSKLKRGQSKYYTQFGVPPENQKELKKINAQITRLTPVIYSPDVNGKVSVESNGEIKIMVKEYENKMYIFAVNMKMKNDEATFKVSGLKTGTKINVDEENRFIEAKDGEFTDKFSEYAVHIYVVSK